ncbi:MAG: SIMPL domain-containing protein [Bacteroidales bacterium]|nr:SIMPL domain-containing protein [Bacteroidales bacterium]MBQ7490358.1 SIMPL domain-containing protein [Bacteroidales bacterium]
MSNNAKIVISTIIGICFILGAVALGVSFYKAKGPQKTISVVGLAERDFNSDLIVLDFSYSTQNMDMKTAYEELKKQNEIVKAFLTKKGIPEADVTFKAINNDKDYEYNYNYQTGVSNKTFRGYIFSQSVRISSKQVELVEALYQSLVELIDEGVNVDAYSPDYYYTKLGDLKMEMLAKATEDAHSRAQIIAENAGATLGGLKVANTGVFQITAPNSSDEDYTWGGVFNTSSKAKRASVNMRLTYYVK